MTVSNILRMDESLKEEGGGSTAAVGSTKSLAMGLPKEEGGGSTAAVGSTNSLAMGLPEEGG